MKVIAVSILVAFALAGIAALWLRSFQEPADVAFATSGTRVGDSSTTNLVGPKWNGLNDR